MAPSFLWPLSSISRGSCGLVRSHIRARPCAHGQVSAIGRERHVGCDSEIGKCVHFIAGFDVPEPHRPIPARRGDPAARGVKCYAR